jgi:outer membrane lipoprotein-sorting protein
MRNRFSGCLLLFLLPFSLFSQNATEIVRKADQVLHGESSISEITMTIVRPQWSRQVSMKGWSKGDDYSLILITAPPRDKGTAFLKRGKEVWQWVPSINRTIKIPPSMMGQSWMGSDFTNDDLVREASVVNDYDHKLLPDTSIDGTAVYRIEMIPKPDAPVVWGRVEAWIGKEDYIERKVFFYDETGLLINTMTLSDIKEMGGRKIPAKLEMVPADKKGHSTTLEYKDIKFDVPIENSFFSLQNLKQVR